MCLAEIQAPRGCASRPLRHNGTMQDFEKLGAFYLGRVREKDDLLLYDSRHLVTHAVCVGMTGSGKTGLAIGLLEEAAIDGVPAIVIDPKGDLTNLLLTFPGLRPEDFRPWVNSDEARTQGIGDDEYAARQAALWTNGLAQWGQDGDRIERLRNAADFAIYTPRSTAGIPVSIVHSLDAPPDDIREDPELLRERLHAAASNVLALAGIETDPANSREYTFLATLFDHAWREGRSLDLETLIGAIQRPPFTRLGALDLNSVYPEKDRFTLASALNNRIASPGFSAWLDGEPLDIGRMLHTAEGKPRVSVFTIAHLDDAERMFFVTLLLNQVVAWMRAQQGTTSLRALLFMDEIFGYFPPVRNPPSKLPLLTLLKQARAFGLGVVLATQNPVDLDYKGLANAGTWFIGRLQTERDKARLLDGLEGAAAARGQGFTRADMERMLSGLGKRVFLLNNVHEDAPVLFETRWTLSYLRGPLGREGIKMLMAPKKEQAQHAAGSPLPPPARAASNSATSCPTPPPGVEQYFIPAAGPAPSLRPVLLGAAQVRFSDARRKIDSVREVVFLAPVEDGPVPVNWDRAVEAKVAVDDLEAEPPAGASYEALPAAAAQARNYAAWKREFAAWLAANQKLVIWMSPSTGQVSGADESERDFRIRNQLAAREARDQAVDDLRRKYAPKITVLQERLRRAQQALQREMEQAQAQKMQTAVSIGTTLLGAFFGRKAISTGTLGRASTAMRSATRARKESMDVTRSGDTVETLQTQLADLEFELETEVSRLKTGMDASNEMLTPLEIRPKKTQIAVRLVALAWTPQP